MEKSFFQHHIFPQKLRDFSKKIGIDVDDCIIVVAEWFHKWIHGGGAEEVGGTSSGMTSISGQKTS